MSQFQTFIGSEGPGPGPILSLTGDSGGAVGPSAGGNINILSENNPTIVPFGPPTFAFAEVTGSPVLNTLVISPIVSTVITNDATPTTIYQLLIPANTSAVITANVIGTISDFSSVCGGIITVIARKNGAANAAATSSGLITTDYIGNPPPTVTGTSDALHALIQVKGNVGETWDWSAQINYIFNEV